MRRDSGRAGSAGHIPVIERTSPRAVFAQLVAGALGETDVCPTPMAVDYLVQLLTDRVRLSGEPSEAGEPTESSLPEGTLAAALVAARVADTPLRVKRLRNLGDRTLFVAGFFGDSLARRQGDIDYYTDVGCYAYSDLASLLVRRLDERSRPRLYEELADRFRDFIAVLAEVSDSTMGRRSANILQLYDRYLQTGDPQDRARLLRHGCVVPPRIPGSRSSGRLQ